MPQFPHVSRTDEGHSPAANADGATMFNPFRVKAAQYNELFLTKEGKDLRLQPGWGQLTLGARKEETREYEPTIRWPLRENRRVQ